MSFTSFSCNSYKTIDEKSGNSQLILKLKKTPCFGECPVFEFQLFNNQTAFYKGTIFVEKIGEFACTLSDEDFKELKNLIDSLKITQLNKEYIDRQILDLPSTIISLEGKKIEYQQHLAPENLLSFTNNIELIMDNLKWEETLPAN